MDDVTGFRSGTDNSWQAYIHEPPIPKRVRRVRRINWDLKNDRRQMDAALRAYKRPKGRRLYTPHEDMLILTTRPLKALCAMLERSPDAIWSRHWLLKKKAKADNHTNG